MKNSKTKKLTEAALLIAVASVLCVFPKFKFLPNGGSITLCSMLPIVLISYRQGLKAGFTGGLVFAMVQIFTGFSASGLTGTALVVEFLFDYLFAFTVLGIGGIFRGKFKKASTELALGSLVALFLRYICHIISGYVVWGEYASWFFSSVGSWGETIMQRFTGNGLLWLYSIIYNGSFMIPEMILTCIAAVLISPYALYDPENKAG